MLTPWLLAQAVFWPITKAGAVWTIKRLELWTGGAGPLNWPQHLIIRNWLQKWRQAESRDKRLREKSITRKPQMEKMDVVASCIGKVIMSSWVISKKEPWQNGRTEQRLHNREAERLCVCEPAGKCALRRDVREKCCWEIDIGNENKALKENMKSQCDAGRKTLKEY